MPNSRENVLKVIWSIMRKLYLDTDNHVRLKTVYLMFYKLQVCDAYIFWELLEELEAKGIIQLVKLQPTIPDDLARIEFSPFALAQMGV